MGLENIKTYLGEMFSNDAHAHTQGYDRSYQIDARDGNEVGKMGEHEMEMEMEIEIEIEIEKTSFAW